MMVILTENSVSLVQKIGFEFFLSGFDWVLPSLTWGFRLGLGLDNFELEQEL